MKNYISELTHDDIEIVLNKCGLTIIPPFKNDRDEIVEGMQKFDNTIIVRCVKKDNFNNQSLQDILNSSLDKLNNIDFSSLNNFEILLIEDFYIHRLSETEGYLPLDEKLNKEYFFYMSDKYENYQDDFDIYYKKLLGLDYENDEELEA